MNFLNVSYRPPEFSGSKKESFVKVQSHSNFFKNYFVITLFEEQYLKKFLTINISK